MQCIRHLLEADITKIDQTLRLLFAIDHIHDWARDRFRRDVCGQLAALMPGSKKYTREDEDIESLRTEYNECQSDYAGPLHNVRRWQIEEVAPNSDLSISEFLEEFDRKSATESLCIRDMAHMNYHVCGLQITESLVYEYLSTAPNELEARRLAIIILDSFEFWDYWHVAQDFLRTMETIWAEEKELEGRTNLDDNEAFLVQVCIKSYLGSLDSSDKSFDRHLLSDWQQIHDLCYVAISPKALVVLQDYLAYPNHEPPVTTPPLSVKDQKALLKELKIVRNCAVQQCLTAAIRRLVVLSFAAEDGSGPFFGVYDEPEHGDPIPCAWKLPGKAYKRHKISMREPSAPHLNSLKLRTRRSVGDVAKIPVLASTTRAIRTKESAVLVVCKLGKCLFLRTYADQEQLSRQALSTFKCDMGPVRWLETFRMRSQTVPSATLHRLLRKFSVQCLALLDVGANKKCTRCRQRFDSYLELYKTAKKQPDLQAHDFRRRLKEVLRSSKLLKMLDHIDTQRVDDSSSDDSSSDKNVSRRRRNKPR